MENKTGLLFTDDTPRHFHKFKYPHYIDGNNPETICIQLKARHFVTCPVNDTGFVCVEDSHGCYGCECYDVVNSTEHSIHCNGIFGNWDQKRLHINKNEIIKNWIESEGEME
jgi:hypothetical protein